MMSGRTFLRGLILGALVGPVAARGAAGGEGVAHRVSLEREVTRRGWKRLGRDCASVGGILAAACAFGVTEVKALGGTILSIAAQLLASSDVSTDHGESSHRSGSDQEGELE